MAPQKINIKDRISADGEIDLSMSDLQDVPVRDIVTTNFEWFLPPIINILYFSGYFQEGQQLRFIKQPFEEFACK